MEHFISHQTETEAWVVLISIVHIYRMNNMVKEIFL